MSERNTIETEANVATTEVRAHEFPALEEGNISFPKGRYLVDFERLPQAVDGEGTFAITHRIEGAALLERLMEEQGEKKVQFVCTISSPASSYRSTQVSETARQVLKWDEDDLGEPPLFTPMIVVRTPFRQMLDANRDGVHALWEGQSVDFEPGMRLAVSSVVQLQSSVLQLLSFHADESLKNGEFRVSAETEGNFQFRVNLAPDLHRFLRYRGADPAGDHILTHVVSSCLSLLKSDWGEDAEEEGWRSYRSLQLLSEQLKSQGFSDWSDPEFAPELVATKLHPHKVPEVAVEEAEE